MLLLTFIKRNVLFHSLIVILYSVLFLVQLLFVAEYFYETGYNEEDWENTTYTFEIYQVDFDTLDALNNRLICYPEFRYAIKYEGFDVEYIGNMFDESNYGRYDYPDLNEGEIALHSGASLYSMVLPLITDLPEEYSQEFYEHYTNNKDDIQYIDENGIIINGIELKVISQGVFISYSFMDSQLSSMYCNLETFASMAAYKESALVTVKTEEKLTTEELNDLKSAIGRIAGPFEYHVLVSEYSEKDLLISSFFWGIAVLVILAAVCFSELMSAVMAKRDTEYRVLKFCGASGFNICVRKFCHLLFVVMSAEIVGILLFVILRKLTITWIAYNADTMFFWVTNMMVFLLASVLAFLISSLIKRIRK